MLRLLPWTELVSRMVAHAQRSARFDHEFAGADERDACALYLLDRAAQYKPSSGMVAAIEGLVRDIKDGTARERFDAGEYDNLKNRLQPRKPPT